MLWQTIGDLLPTAAAVALSPIPIVAVILVLGSARAKANGPAFAVGWVAGLTVVCVAVLLLTGGADDPDSATATGVSWGKAALGLVLVAMAHRQWKKRPRHGETPEMPKWMSTVEGISAPRAAGLGVLLSAVNPKNLILTAAAAATIAESGMEPGDEAITIAVFVVLGSVTVVGAVLASILGGHRVEAPLDSIRRFMADNNAVIMTVILLLLGLKIFGDSLGGITN